MPRLCFSLPLCCCHYCFHFICGMPDSGSEKKTEVVKRQCVKNKVENIQCSASESVTQDKSNRQSTFSNELRLFDEHTSSPHLAGLQLQNNGDSSLSIPFFSTAVCRSFTHIWMISFFLSLLKFLLFHRENSLFAFNDIIAAPEVPQRKEHHHICSTLARIEQLQ